MLERYKRRIEWFHRDTLLKTYNEAESGYEKIFEDDLRLFLFDQGIDYPFSTPHSASGRADVVGLLDTKSPLIVEIKIWDSSKSYRKARLLEGFNQIVQYTSDYNKEVGYLVVFNCDNVEIEVESEDSKLNFPNRVLFNNRTYYIVVVNMFNELTASKKGALTKEKLTKDELIRQCTEI